MEESPPGPGSFQERAESPSPTSEKDRDLELKRVRGEISCAECRRQKLKCNKKIPCSSCVRRGCQSVCPTGLLSSRHKASSKTERLYRKLLIMSKRIQQLENALQVLQACVSSTFHPLLSKDLLDVKIVDTLDDPEEPPDTSEADIHIDFGSLTISEQGVTHFVGRSGAEVMMAAVVNENAQEIRQRAMSKLPLEVAHVAETFPFVPIRLPKDRILSAIESRLPSYDRATALIEAYLQNISSFFRPVGREQIMGELLPKFYKHRDITQSPNDGHEIAAHQLALMLAVFACGAAGDLTMDSCNEEGEMFRYLARSALGMHSVFEGTSLATVQALALVGAYDLYSASTETIESAFKLLGLAHCLGITIGLHWEPSSWNIESKYVQRRRNLFWELYVMDIFKSMASGRPVMLRRHEIDCQFPDDDDAKVNEDGSTTQGFWRWKYEYATSISTDVTEKMCSVHPMKYSDILELDRKVRAIHRTFVPTTSMDATYSTTALQQLIKVIHGEAVLLFIHRNFFITALRENPKDPLNSRFASSFLATIASAITMLRFVRRDYEHSNQLLLRHWTLWVVTLGAGVVVGTVAATQMHSELAQTALQELQLAIELFEKAIAHPVTKNGLPILLSLRDKALSNMSFDKLHNAPNAPVGRVPVKTEEVDEALSLIGGTSRVVRNEHMMQVPNRSATLSTAASAPTTNFRTSDSTKPISTISLQNPLSMRSDSTWGPADLATIGSYLHPSAVDVGLLAYHIGPNLNAASDPAFTQSQSRDYSQLSMLRPSAVPDLDLWPSASHPASQHGVNTEQLQGSTPDSSAFPLTMSFDPSSYDFDIGWLSSGGMPSTGSQEVYSQPGDIDGMIEDTWRTIMGDPRFTNTGVNEPTFQM